MAERPWHEIPDVVRCGACFGALPPDTEAACEYCGVGTPLGLAVLQPLVEQPAELPQTVPTPAPPNYVMAVDLVYGPKPAGWMSTLRSWARWPNA